MASNTRQLELLMDMSGENDTDILGVPLIEQLFRDFMPSLLDGSEASGELIGEISYYLLKQRRLTATPFKEKVEPELYTALYGLKSLLEKHHKNNLNLVSWSLEEHKRRFGKFLDELLEEE